MKFIADSNDDVISPWLQGAHAPMGSNSSQKWRINPVIAMVYGISRSLEMNCESEVQEFQEGRENW